MAHFDATSNGTTGVQIAAAVTAQRPRFTCIGFTNSSATAYMVTLYDGTAAAGTARAYFSLPALSTLYYPVDNVNRHIFPKNWFTAGNAVEFIINAGTTEIHVFGDFVSE